MYILASILVFAVKNAFFYSCTIPRGPRCNGGVNGTPRRVKQHAPGGAGWLGPDHGDKSLNTRAGIMTGEEEEDAGVNSPDIF